MLLTTSGDDRHDAGISFRIWGTPGYHPPEIDTVAGIGTASDMYCAGVCHAHLLGTQTDHQEICELFVTKIDSKGVENKGVLLEPYRGNTPDCSSGPIVSAEERLFCYGVVGGGFPGGAFSGGAFSGSEGAGGG